MIGAGRHQSDAKSMDKRDIETRRVCGPSC
jgi:hypothetical protein